MTSRVPERAPCSTANSVAASSRSRCTAALNSSQSPALHSTTITTKIVLMLRASSTSASSTSVDVRAATAPSRRTATLRSPRITAMTSAEVAAATVQSRSELPKREWYIQSGVVIGPGRGDEASDRGRATYV